MTITYSGRMRLHFNRHGAAPLVWCISTDAWELAVSTLIITAPIESAFRPKATDDDDDGKPSAWFETDGVLRLGGSTAFIGLPEVLR